tara:strand:- start:573 stop:686 length:114 start_codon:yes stop_codon:yes gene_type:complete
MIYGFFKKFRIALDVDASRANPDYSCGGSDVLGFATR